MITNRSRRGHQRTLVNGRWVTEGNYPHGTDSTYSNMDCRCLPCTDAHRINHARMKEQRLRSLIDVDGRPFNPRVEVHGSSAYGNWGCRCRTCTDAYTAATIARMKRREEREK